MYVLNFVQICQPTSSAGNRVFCEVAKAGTQFSLNKFPWLVPILMIVIYMHYAAITWATWGQDHSYHEQANDSTTWQLVRIFACRFKEALRQVT